MQSAPALRQALQAAATAEVVPHAQERLVTNPPVISCCTCRARRRAGSRWTSRRGQETPR